MQAGSLRPRLAYRGGRKKKGYFRINDIGAELLTPYDNAWTFGSGGELH
jgi:hypothetical protein